MNTTDNTYSDTPKKRSASKDDIKGIKADYDKGATIDALADKYNLSASEVEQAVVVDVTPEAPALQASTDTTDK